MFDYIVVQAGGRGSRLKELTDNKPKALVPIDNLPMIFHLFRKFPNKKFVIIGDYKFDVFERYLNSFADVDFSLVDARNSGKGTLSGLGKALRKIPNGQPFMLIWSDLVLDENFEEPKQNANYVGIMKNLPCRWRFVDGKFEEVASNTDGVAGLFIFENKEILGEVPQEGEFVRFLSTKNINFKRLSLENTKEFGLLEVVEKLNKPTCRPFNKITFNGDRVVKEYVDAQGKDLAEKEVGWYRFVKSHTTDETILPKIFNFEPLEMENLAFENEENFNLLSANLSRAEKRDVLQKIVELLSKIHEIAHCETDYESFCDTYLIKTMNRLKKVKNLVPFADQERVVINSKPCRNIFFEVDKVSKAMFEFYPKQFSVIHGDSTFSNILLSKEKNPVLIDPRGYFGKTKIFGDEAYDWAKLYYSLVGNYDQFNRKNFSLKIEENSVTLKIASSGWEFLEDEFFNLLGSKVSKKQIKLIHLIIWFSLTTYVWNDYDMICGAFYQGCLLLENFCEEFEL